HTRAFVLLVGVNALLAGAFFLLARRRAPVATEAASRRSALADGAPGEFRPATLLTLAALSGFVSGALEVDMFRAVRFAGAITDPAMSFPSFWAIVAIFAASSVVRLLGRPRPALMRFAILGSLLAHLFTWEELSVLRSWFNAQYMDWVAANASRDPDVVNATI